MNKPSREKARALRILCAEDSLLLGEILVSLFSRAGYKIEHVPNGWEAWKRLARDIDTFDVLITDHEMPGLNGLALTARVVEAKFRGRVIVYTSVLSGDLTAQYRALGVAAVVTKESRPDILLHAVNAAAGE